MEAILNPVEARVLASLIEKALTTPDYYPLTLNALTNACNQLTNREPIVTYDEKTVVRALDSLREKKLVWMVTTVGARVPKYEHRFGEAYNLSEQETAAMCVLMLRGPQTAGEIRGRSGRLYEFKELDEVELTLQSLMNAEPQPLVVKLARQPGTKESRFAHTLGGEVHLEEGEAAPRKLEQATLQVRAEAERIANLESRVELLERQLSQVQQEFVDFKKQFE